MKKMRKSSRFEGKVKEVSREWEYVIERKENIDLLRFLWNNKDLGLK